MKYDAIIIGAGQAGPSLAARLTHEGLRTAIIERQLVGGTCVNVGCTPTKTLVGSARVAHFARTAAEFGVDTGDVTVDMRRVKARMDLVRGESNQGLTDWLEGMQNLDLIRGHARFVDPTRIRVDDSILEADRIFINVGARARVPDIPGLAEVPFLTNSDILELDHAPEHLIVVGGSYVGLEFAQIYRRFGSDVTVIEMADRLIPREDEDVSGAIQDILEAEGIRIELAAECVGVTRSADGIDVTASCNRDLPSIRGSHLLLAVGRVPNTHDLGLDNAGIEIDDRGLIKVDDTLQTSAANVWAMGEANGRGAFTHTAYNDFEILAANLFTGVRRRVSDRIDCYGLFTDPPLGRVGLTERAAREAGHSVRIGRRLMKNVARAREFGETQGLMKLVVDAESDLILGAAILGINGDESVQSVIGTMAAGLPYSSIMHSVYIHPTVTELIPTVLGELETSN